MARKFFTGTLLALSSIFLAFSLIATIAIWGYREPLKQDVAANLARIDGELSQAEATLGQTEGELERALQLVETTEKALQELAEQTGSAENIFENIQSTLDDRLIPDLKTTRERLGEARATLENLRAVLNRVTSFIPFVDLNAPDQVLADLIISATSLDTDISQMELLALEASTFVSDTSYLLGGDLGETKTSLQNFLAATREYQQKVADWREQVVELNENAPRRIDQAAIGLTIFLAWFALSQFGLILHGISMQYGENPLWVLRGK